MSTVTKRSRSRAPSTGRDSEPADTPSTHSITPLVPLFRDAFAVTAILIGWALILLAQTVPGRVDLTGVYGLYVAMGFTAVALVTGFITSPLYLPASMALVASFGFWKTQAWISAVLAKKYEVFLAGVWNEVFSVGCGAYGTAEDYIFVCIICFAHVAMEFYRRDKKPYNFTILFWLVSVFLLPAIFYPIWLGFSGIYGKNQPSIVKKLGHWPQLLYGSAGCVFMLLWAPSVMEMYRTCGNQRWSPNDFRNCGLNTTPSSEYTVHAILSVSLAFFFGPTSRTQGERTVSSPSKFASFLWKGIVQLCVAIILFLNVAAGVAFQLALITFDD